MLRKIRIAVAVALLALVTFYFVDFAGILPQGFSVLARIQFVPALLMHSAAIVLALLAVTLLLGRIYCSVVCPLGIFQDVVTRVGGFFRKKKKRYKYSPARNVLRYGILGITAVSFLLGFTLLLSLLDPYAAYGRIASDLMRPVYMEGNNLLETVFTSLGSYAFYRVDVSVRSVVSLVVAAFTMLGVGYLAWRYGRVYCNTVCPVGTILGLVSRFSPFKVRIDASKCNGCGVCATRCKSSCIDGKNHRIDNSRCVDCFDCLGACRQGALSFSGPKAKMTSQKTVECAVSGEMGEGKNRAVSDGSRRKFLAAGAVTAVAVPLALVGQGRKRHDSCQGQANGSCAGEAGGGEHPASGRTVAIAPPGAESHEHLTRHCTACHLCVSKCPSHVLKPAFLQYGLGGMMQPVMDFEKGFCNFDCTVCGDVCPNGAIRPLTVEQKHLTQVGKVVFLERFCIVHTDGTSCGACSEHCPTQAVSMVPYRDGLTIPHTDPSICVGCGGCEYVCPATPHKAIYVEGNAVQQQAEPFDKGENYEEEIDGFGF